MRRRTLLGAVPLALLVPREALRAMQSALAPPAPGILPAEAKEKANPMAASTAVYELRIYHVNPGKLDSLVARFRDHTDGLFAKHGIKSVAYWTALDEPTKSNTFIYVLEHPSREAAATNWKSFQDDPDWKAVKAKTEENGKLVDHIDSTFLTLTDFSKGLS